MQTTLGICILSWSSSTLMINEWIFGAFIGLCSARSLHKITIRNSLENFKHLIRSEIFPDQRVRLKFFRTHNENEMERNLKCQISEWKYYWIFLSLWASSGKRRMWRIGVSYDSRFITAHEDGWMSAAIICKSAPDGLFSLKRMRWLWTWTETQFLSFLCRLSVEFVSAVFLSTLLSLPSNTAVPLDSTTWRQRRWSSSKRIHHLLCCSPRDL